MRFTLLPLAALTALLGCGGHVLIDGSSATGAAGGTGGAGGAPTTTTGQGGASDVCGGKQGLACPNSQWCQYPPDSVCGCCDMTGACTPKPQDCDLDCPGVCGCDGQTYCNECAANQAGVGVDPTKDCSAPPPYSLHVLPTDVPRFVIFRSDGKTCTRVTVSTLAGFDPYQVDVTPPWDVESVVITNNAGDCKVGGDQMPVPPKDQVVVASTATGTIVIDLPDIPCGADANLTIEFPNGGPWVPPSIPFVSGYLWSGLPCDL